MARPPAPSRGMSARGAFLVTLFAAILLPTASACSIAEGAGDGPGAISAWDLASGKIWYVPVDSKELGSDCSLQNDHDFDGRRVVWREGTQLKLYDFLTRRSAALPDPFGGRVVDWESRFAPHLAGGHVVLVGEEVQYHLYDMDRERWLTYSFYTRWPVSTESEQSPATYPQTAGRIVLVDGPRVLFGADTASDRVAYSLFDITRSDWVFRGWTTAEFKVPPASVPVGLSERLIVFVHDADSRAYDLASAEARAVPQGLSLSRPGGRQALVDDGHVFQPDPEGKRFLRWEFGAASPVTIAAPYHYEASEVESSFVILTSFFGPPKDPSSANFPARPEPATVSLPQTHGDPGLPAAATLAAAAFALAALARRAKTP